MKMQQRGVGSCRSQYLLPCHPVSAVCWKVYAVLRARDNYAAARNVQALHTLLLCPRDAWYLVRHPRLMQREHDISSEQVELH